MNQFRIHPFVPAKYKKQKHRIENEEYVNIRREIVSISVVEARRKLVYQTLTLFFYSHSQVLKYGQRFC